MEKKGVGRPRDGNPEETRREIVRAAGEAFAAAGFVGATTRAVAARAGVNVATLHYLFGSKEGLYRAVLANASRDPLPALPAGADAVSRLVETLFAYGAERPTLARLALLDALAGPPARGGEEVDARVRWTAAALGPLLAPADGAPGAGRDAARAIVLLVDAAFVAAAARDLAPAGEGAVAPVLPDETTRHAVAAAALRLTGREQGTGAGTPSG